MVRGPIRSVLWIAFSLLLGTGLHAAGDPLISVKVESDLLVAGQRFTFVIRLHDNGLATPVGTLPAIDPRISILSGPEITTETAADESGRQGRFVFMRYVARANTPGYAELPPIAVQYGVQSLKTGPVLLKIRKDEANAEIPPDLAWNVHADRIYRGQSVFITLDLVHSPTIVFPDSIEIPSLGGGSFEEVRGVGRIESDRLAGRDFQRLPVAGFLFTPSSAGQVNLPLARVSLGKTVLATLPFGLTVLEPPALADLSAIGDLKLVTTLESTAVGRGETARLSVRIEGTGNLRTLRLPEPVLLGLNLVSKSENGKYLPTEQGYRGFREVVYQLGSAVAGVYSVAIPPCPVLGFDGQLNLGEPRSLSLEVLDVASTQKKDQPAVQMRLLTLRQALELMGGGRGAVPDWAAAFEAGLNAYDAADYADALAQFTRALKIGPDHPGILYNLGVTNQARGSSAHAVYYLLLALRQRPHDQVLRQALEGLEQQLGLKHQLAILVLPPPGFLVAGLAVFLILGLGGFAVFVWRRNLRWLLAGFVLVACGAVVAGGLWLDRWQRELPVGVVSETGTMMRRIPEARSREWLQLASGTSVRIEAEYQGYLLVETAFGSKGWVERSSLYLRDDQAVP